jgi:hypothetical protein
MSKKTIVKTGERAPISGQYKPSGSKQEITMVKGKVVPPNITGGKNSFTLVDKTKHKK